MNTSLVSDLGGGKYRLPANIVQDGLDVDPQEGESVFSRSLPAGLYRVVSFVRGKAHTYGREYDWAVVERETDGFVLLDPTKKVRDITPR
tara:strand:- start:1191 stop:1460 length:270 start_codon:yes stop_codon:yes gene_type:complete